MVEKMTPAERDRCLVCNRSRSTCFCGFVKPFDTNTRFVLLMHPKEYKRQKTGTGRLTALALRNSEIIMGSDFSDDQRLLSILSDSRNFPVLLYPGPGSSDLAGGNFTLPPGRRLVVLVIDGTWRTADSVYKRSVTLHGLMQVKFMPEKVSRFIIKRQPRKECLSTIEAVHSILDLLDKSGIERLDGRHMTLIDSLEKIVKYQSQFMQSRRRRS